MSDASGADRAGSDAAGADPAEPGLEALLRRLEEIVSTLEADEVELERALELFEEGVGHVRAAEAVLARTELRVQELLASASEDVVPFEEGDP